MDPETFRAAPNTTSVLLFHPVTAYLFVFAGIKRAETPGAILTDEMAGVIITLLIRAAKLIIFQHLLQVVNSKGMHLHSNSPSSR